MNSLPPYFTSALFNSSAFTTNDYLTKEEADNLYLSIRAASVLAYLDPANPGIVTANKAVIADSNRDLINFHNIESTDSDSHILFSGHNSHLTLSGSGSHINISNTENANSTGSHGAIKCQGGIYTNGGNFFNSTTQMNGIVSILDSTDSTSYNNGSLTLNGGIGIAKSMYINGSLFALNTNDSTAFNTGSVQISGGLSVAKNIYSLTNTLDLSSGGDMLTLKTSSASARNTIKFINDSYTWEIGTRSSTASNPNTFYIYNSSYKLLMNTTGDISLLSTTDSNSTFTAGSLKLAGGLSVAKNINCYKNIITNNGNQLILQTGSSPTDYSALIEVPGSGTLHMATTFSSVTTHVTIGKGLWVSNVGTGGSRGYPLDFGSSARDCIISLYATGLDDTSTYGLGANNSALQFISPQSFSWINNSSSFPGNIRMYIDSAGKMALGNSASPACGLEVSNGTVRIKTQSSPVSGEGLELAYDAGSDTANIYSFNRSEGSYYNLNLNDTMYLSGDRYVGIRKSNPICTLDIGSSVTSSTLNSFGYLSSSGSGTATGFSNRAFSIRTSNGIRVDSGEIDVISDIRLKKNIELIDESIVKKVLDLEAITFKYNLQSEDDPQFHFGFRAQDLVKKNLNQIVGFCDSDEPLPDEDIICDDGTIVHLRGSQRLLLNLPEIIPILQKALQIQQKKITRLEDDSEHLRELIEYQQKEIDLIKDQSRAETTELSQAIIVLQDHVKFLLSENKENNERLDELIDVVNNQIES